MEKRKATADTFVGLIVLTALLLLNLVTFLIRDDLFGNTTRLRATFDSVPGLEVGSPVLVSGIRSGRVVAINYKPVAGPVRQASAAVAGGNGPLQSAQPVIVVMRIKNKVPVYTNARVRLVQQGFIGDKRVEIDPGTSEGGTLIHDDSDPIPGEPQMDLTNVMKKAEQVVDDLGATVHSIRQVMTDEQTILTIRDTITNLSKAVEKTYAYLERNEESVAAAVEDLQIVAANMKDFSRQMARFAGEGGRADQIADETQSAVAELRGQMSQALEKAQATITSIDSAVERMDARAETLTTSATGFIDSTQADVRSVRVSLEETSANLNEVILGVRRGEGTFGRLMTDPAPFEDLKRSIEALQEFLVGASRKPPLATIPYGLPPAATAPEDKAPR